MSRARSGRSAITAAALGGFLAGAIDDGGRAPELLDRAALAGGQQAAGGRAARLGRPKKDSPPVADVGSQGRSSPDLANRCAQPCGRRRAAKPAPTARAHHRAGSGRSSCAIGGSRSRCRGWRGASCVTPSTRRAVRPRTTKRSISSPPGTPRSWPSKTASIAKLFESKKGGTTVYQFDPSTRYAVLLRPPRALRRRAQGRQPRPARAGPGLRRHVRQRAERHAPPALRDFPADGQEAMVAGQPDRSLRGIELGQRLRSPRHRTLLVMSWFSAALVLGRWRHATIRMILARDVRPHLFCVNPAARSRY